MYVLKVWMGYAVKSSSDRILPGAQADALAQIVSTAFKQNKPLLSQIRLPADSILSVMLKAVDTIGNYSK